MARRQNSDAAASDTDSVTIYTKFVTTHAMLHDFSALSRDKKFIQHSKWLQNVLRETGIGDTMDIPFMTDQRVIRVTRRNRDGKEYHEMMGINREGLNEVFNIEEIIDRCMCKKLHNAVFTDTIIGSLRHRNFGQVRLFRTVVCSDTTLQTLPPQRLRLRPTIRYNGMADYRMADYWTPYDTLLSDQLREDYRQDSIGFFISVYDSAGIARHAQTAVQQNVTAAAEYINRKCGWGMNIITFPLKAFVNNYIEIGHRPIFAIEPVVSIFSVNTEDGFRLRLGGKTTANLLKRDYFGGYVSYGFGSGRVYGMGRYLHSFIDKIYDPAEFPRRSISLTYRNDICPLGERNLHTDHDNLFMSYQWGKKSHMMLYNLEKLEAEWEMRNGIGFTAGIKREEDTALQGMTFHTLHDLNLDLMSQLTAGEGILTDHGTVCTTELRFAIGYTPPSQRFETRKSRAPINSELPYMALSHHVGIKIFGGHYNFNLSEVKVDKFWYLGRLGRGRTTLRAGCLWNRVPFPILFAPTANVSYVSDDNSFGLLRKSEFLTDRSVQLNLSLETNGNIIGLIPLIKRLRWREFLAVRMFLGALSDKNNPTLIENGDSHILMPMPVDSYVMDGTEPYVEGVVGIHNIFHIFNFDYVFRLTYRDRPESSSNGFRFSVRF